jgi:uncharacterized protein (UPF0305 family)
MPKWTHISKKSARGIKRRNRKELGERLLRQVDERIAEITQGVEQIEQENRNSDEAWREWQQRHGIE